MDHNADRAPPRKPTLPITAPTAPARKPMSMSVPGGFLPVLTYASFALVLPVLWFYASYDVTSDAFKGVTIGLASAAALLVVIANDCCCWYNMVLFFHIGLEVKVLDVTITFARAASTSDTDMGLAIAATTVVVVHLLPFLLSDRFMLLALLAFAGVVVNACTLALLVEPVLLLLVGASSLVLLAATLIVAGVCGIKTSLLGHLRDAVAKGEFIACKTYGM